MDTNKNTKEIDVIGIIKKVWSAKTSLYISICVSAIIGIVVALNTPKDYTSTVVLAPELSSGGLGMSSSLSDMASTFGIDLGSKSSIDAIYPEIYPEIFASSDFVKQMFNIRVQQMNSNQVKTLKEHLLKDNKIPFWQIPKIWIAKWFAKKGDSSKKHINDNTFLLSKKDEALIASIKNNISCLIDNKTSVITISVTDQDPMVAAIVADTLQHRLQNYITDYKTRKARIDLQYYQKLYTQSKKDYLKAQSAYASYSDANESVVLQSVKSKIDEYENEMQLKFNAYAQMATQLQNAKAKVQEHTPAFTIIEQPKTSNKASSTPRSFIVIVFIFIGMFVDAIWVLLIKGALKKK